MTRVLSGAVLIAIAVAVVWFAPNPIFLAVALLLAAGAVVELVGLARASGMTISIGPALIVSCFVVVAVGVPELYRRGFLEVCLMTALLSAAALGGWFLLLAVRLLRDTSRANARGLFLYSLAYLALMFAAIGIDRINF